MAGLPITSSTITTRLVEGNGVQSAIAANLVTEDHYSIGMTAAITADGTDLDEATLWWVGQPLSISFPATQIFPHISDQVQMTLNFNPSATFFFPNSSCTNWSSGKDAILRSEFSVQGGEAGNITEVKSLDWMYRIKLVVSNNIRQGSVILQVIPVSSALLESLTDPWSPELCVIPFVLTTAPWSTPSDPAMRFYGPVPAFLDRRGGDAKAAGTFPDSHKIKSFISRVMINCSANLSLEENEVVALIHDQTRHPPSRPATFAEWPVIPPDIVPPPTGPGAAGFTPSQSALQSRGWFSLSENIVHALVISWFLYEILIRSVL